MHSDQMEMTFTNLLGIATRDFEQGRYLQAHMIFGSLADVDFTGQRQARYGESIALAAVGRLEKAYGESEKILADLVSEQTEPTVFKANTLVSLAEVKIGLRQFGGVEQLLDEAIQIYSDQGVPNLRAAAVHLQGIVALNNGEYEDALEKLNWARTLSEINIPETMPNGFGIESPVEQSFSDVSRHTALSIRA